MKRQVVTILAIFLVGLLANAQSPGSPPCRIYITGSFEPECLYEDKTNVENEYPGELIACKEGSVVYTARSVSAVSSWQWTVMGAASYTVSGNSVTVHWGAGESGTLTVSAECAGGEYCSETRGVRLVDVPEADAVTVPTYTVNAYGEKVIRICKGGSVRFQDQSVAGNSDIAGYGWSSDTHPSAATAGYTMEDVQEGSKVRHRVYNNCGCYDEEEYLIEVAGGTEMELKCYGTVCENARVTYHLLSPGCDVYQWYVDGGTLVDGQGTPEPTVVWDTPTEGYGVLGLDGVLCGEESCPTLLMKKVPVIHGGLQIEGPAELCEGESAVYSLPLFGSTAYEWSVSPAAGVILFAEDSSHEARLTFTVPGTYTVEASYRCAFIGCGPYRTQAFTVEVKPVLEIEGEKEICLSTSARLTLSPAVPATWRIYDRQRQLVGTVAASASLSYTFTDPGVYMVEAEHPAYCTPSVFALTVRAAPPAPTMADLDPGNRHVACPNQGIVLRGTPASPAYSLMWDPVSPTASPHNYTGNEVTVFYGDEVGDVRVYHYDRTLGCRSTDYLVHTVSPFTPLPDNLPDQITVCPGQTIVWAVPDQSADGMLYEWKIEYEKQYCASVQGSHLGPGVTLTVNKLASSTVQFYVVLRRTFCDGTLEKVINITVTDNLAQSLTVNCPPPLCEGQSATFSGSGGDPTTYQWNIGGTGYSGATVSHTFHESGDIPVTLLSNPYNYCDNRDYYSVARCTLQVNPLPRLRGIYYNYATRQLELVMAPIPGATYTYTWQRVYSSGFVSLPIGYGSTLSPSGSGRYRCVVTDAITGCSAEEEYTYEAPPCPQMEVRSLNSTYNHCTGEVTVTARGNEPDLGLVWSVVGEATITPDGQNPRRAVVTASEVGTYLVQAVSMTYPCIVWQGLVTVGFLPSFEVEAVCDKVRIVNNSKYLNNNSNQMLRFNVIGGPTFSIPITQETYTFTPPATGSCTVEFVGYGSHTFTPACLSYSVETVSPLTSVSIATGNTNPGYGGQTCDNTPIQLTATTTPARTVTYAEWIFGDGSSFDQAGSSIFHTFMERNDLPYNVTVTVTDDKGCQKESGPFQIQSNPDVLANGVLYADLNTNKQVCPNTTPINVSFSPDMADRYTWTYPDGSTQPGISNYSAYDTPGDYLVYADNNNYCKKEAATFVGFLNAPIADIYVASTQCCVGQTVKLYGDNGPDAGVSYTWTVIDPDGATQVYTDPNITLVPTLAGTYSVTLSVVNDAGCFATTAVPTLLTVNPVPAAPTVSITGSPCISDAPVRLAATGYTGQLFWSNGNTGATAHYYYPGMAEAWYVDPMGCTSDKAQVHIDRQPDFDALLTGCYTQCRPYFPGSLPLYGFTDPRQDIAWRWLLDGSVLASDMSNYHSVPLHLPLTGSGSYSLEVDYAGGSCSETSPVLSLDYRETCPCDGAEVEVQKTMRLEDCHLLWDLDVYVRNQSTGSFCVGELLPLFDTGHEILIHSLVHPGGTLMPGDEIHIKLTLEPLTLEPRVALFETSSDCECAIDFAFDLTPGINCEREFATFEWFVNEHLSNPSTAYMDIHAGFYAGNVLSVRSMPPSVVDWEDNGSGTLTGLLMFDVARLTQLAATGRVVCLEAVVCESDRLCRYRVCLEAQELLEMLNQMGLSGQGGGGWLMASDHPSEDEPSLSPNPTTGEVNVQGVAGRVMEVLVMDMNGREVAAFENTSTFNISSLPSGIYIVRVKTKHPDDQPTKITYLKLVKK